MLVFLPDVRYPVCQFIGWLITWPQSWGCPHTCPFIKLLKSGSIFDCSTDTQVHPWVMASPDLLMLTPPSILRTAIPLSWLNPISYPWQGHQLSQGPCHLLPAWWFQHYIHRGLCPQLLVCSSSVDSRDYILIHSQWTNNIQNLPVPCAWSQQSEP